MQKFTSVLPHMLGPSGYLMFTSEQQPPFYGRYRGQPALASTSSQELEDFVGAEFYCPHALADSNQRIRIREKTLEFSTVSSTLSVPSRFTSEMTVRLVCAVLSVHDR